MKFTKMHGIGNDYIYIDCFREKVRNPSRLAVKLSDRHFGVGGDGLILICPSKVADCKMRIFNADGSEAEMCGNGIRCVAKYAYEHGISKSNPMRVETLAGIKTLKLTVRNGKVRSATVDMGEPRLERGEIPMKGRRGRVISEPLRAAGKTYRVTCVSMGNPHCIIFCKDVEKVPLESIGPVIENHPSFPRRTNVHFVQVISPREVKMRTWERGAGITLACGTGAAAVCVACVLNRRTENTITAHLPGGDLKLKWAPDGHVYMTGSAVEVFTGVLAD